MKKFLEEYGLIIVSIIIVALLIWLIVFFGGRMSKDTNSMFGQFRKTFDKGPGSDPSGGGGSLNNSTALVKANKLIYTGNPQELVKVFDAKGGKLLYRLGGSSYTESIPTGTDAGNYVVYYKLVNTDGTETEEVSLDVVIEKASANMIATPSAKSLVYTGADQELIYAGNCTTGQLQYSSDNINWSTSIPKGKNAGSYPVYYKLDETANYKGISPKTLNARIEKADGIFTAPTAKTLTYNGLAQELVNEGSITVGTLEYKLDGGSWGTAIPTATNAGNYTVYYRVEGNDNYNGVSEQGITVVITKAGSTVASAPTAREITYNGTAQDLINPGSAEGGTMQYREGSGSYSELVPQETDAGTYTVYYRVIGGAAYDDSAEQSLSATISKADCTLTAPTVKTGLIYNGSNQALINGGSATGGTLQYRLNGGSYSTTIPSAKEAGIYSIYYKVVGDKNHNDIAEKSLSVTIGKVNGTLTKPTAKTLTYNGNPQELVTAGSISGGTLQYRLNDGYYGENIPTGTDAGTYTVYYKVVGDDTHDDIAEQSLSVEIKKATPTVTAPVAESLSYTSYAQDLISDGTTTGGTLQYKLGSSGTYSTQIPQATNAGTYTVYYRVVGNKNYNDVAEKSLSVTIDKLVCNITKLPIAKGLVFNGTDQELIVAGTSYDGEMRYKIESSAYSTTIPKKTDAGSYTVYYKVFGDNTHNDSAEKTITAKIEKADLHLVPPSEVRLAYTGTNQPIVQEGYSSDGIIYYKLGANGTYSTSVPQAKDMGTYTVYYKVTGDKNHKDIPETAITSVITGGMATFYVMPTARDLTYNKAAQALVNEGKANGGEVQYKLGTNGTYSTSIPTGTNAGTYTVFYKVVGDSDHDDSIESSVQVQIKKANPVVSVTTKTLTYNTSAQALVTGSTDGGTLQYRLEGGSYSTTVPSATNAGTYKVYYKVIGNSNYNDVPEKGPINVTINKRVPTVTAPTAKTLTYNGSAQTLINAGGTNGGTLQYKLEGGSYGTGLPSAINAGTYKVYYKVVGDGNHTDVAEAGPVNVTINKANGSVTAPTAKTGLVYNGSAQTLINAGSSSTGTIKYKLEGGSYGTGLPSGTNAGTYKVYYMVTGDSNHYDVAEKGPVNVTISKANGSVNAPTAKTLTYNGSAQTLINAGSSSTGTIKYRLEGGSYGTGLPSGTNAGTYKVYYMVTGDSNHYDVAESGPVNVTISKRTPTVTAPTAKTGLVYNASSQTLINAGSTNGGTLQYKLEGGSYGTGLPSGTNAGTYKVYYKVVGDGNNYDKAETGPINVTISKRTPTVTAPTAKIGLKYNGSAQTLINAGSTNGGTLQYKLEGGSYSTNLPSATNAGTYKVYYRVVGDGNNNDKAEAGPISVTIINDSVTVTFNSNLNVAGSVTANSTFVSGSGSYASQTVTKGSTISNPAWTAYADNYHMSLYIEGWYTSSALTTKWDFTQGVQNNMTLYAKWALYLPRIDSTCYTVTPNTSQFTCDTTYTVTVNKVILYANVAGNAKYAAFNDDVFQNPVAHEGFYLNWTVMQSNNTLLDSTESNCLVLTNATKKRSCTITPKSSYYNSTIGSRTYVIEGAFCRTMDDTGFAGYDESRIRYNFTVKQSTPSWTTRTITFNNNGGSGTLPTSITFTSESDAHDMNSTSAPTKNGYTFRGWSASSSFVSDKNKRVAYTVGQAGGSSYCNQTSSWTWAQWCSNTGGNSSNTSMTLYAQWESSTPTTYTYTVKFHYGSDTKTQTFTSGVAQNLSACTFTAPTKSIKYHYGTLNNYNTSTTTKSVSRRFDGWSKTQNGSVQYTDKQSVKDLTTTPNGTVDLYAIYNTYPTAKSIYSAYSYSFNESGSFFDGWSTSMVDSENKYGDDIYELDSSDNTNLVTVSDVYAVYGFVVWLTSTNNATAKKVGYCNYDTSWNCYSGSIHVVPGKYYTTRNALTDFSTPTGKVEGFDTDCGFYALTSSTNYYVGAIYTTVTDVDHIKHTNSTPYMEPDRYSQTGDLFISGTTPFQWVMFRVWPKKYPKLGATNSMNTITLRLNSSIDNWRDEGHFLDLTYASYLYDFNLLDNQKNGWLGVGVDIK